MGAHLIDQVFWALGLTYPTSISGSSTPWGGGPVNPASYPLATLVQYEFAERPAAGLTVAHVPATIDGNELLKRLEKKYGLKLANGQDTLKGKIIRMSHMGYCDQFDVVAALAGLELVLIEMGFPTEPGSAVSAAQRVFA
jgi:aspartate aminotransferase-like enzyme